MESVNEAWFEQMCARLQQDGIAKVSFQTYWYSDEETIDEEQCFDQNEQEVAWPASLSHDDLWKLVEQGKEQFGRFGITITRVSDHKVLPTRTLAEMLVYQAMDTIPTLAQFFQGMSLEAWMMKGARSLSAEISLPSPS